MLTTTLGPGPSLNNRPPTPRPDPAVDRNVYASGALPPLHLFPTESSEGLPEEIPIPKFKTASSTRTSSLYISNYPEDEVDWSEPTPPFPTPQDPGPCRNFRDPHTAAEEERDRHFATHRRERLVKLVATSNALRDAPPLSPTGATIGDEPAEFDSTNDMAEFDSNRGFAGEPDRVYVPHSWRSQRASEDDLFSDVADNGGDTDDDDEEQWDREFARAEEEVSIESDDAWQVEDPMGHKHGGLSTWPNDKDQNFLTKVTTVPASVADVRVAISTDSAAAPYVRHTPTTATREWAYPAAGMPSPTESQLVASGFEFHNELSEEEQIARFGDKAFRKALREVLPSLSRKQQWYAWRRMNENLGGNRNVKEAGVTLKESLKGETKQEIGECVCKCPGNGEDCDGDDGTCAELLIECLCGECEDCDEHYRWHHPDGAFETDAEVEEQHEGGRKIRDDGGEEENKGGDALTKAHRQAVSRNTFCFNGVDGQPNTLTSVCGCVGDEKACRCLPGQCTYEDCPRSQMQYRPPILNAEVKDRPSGWIGSFPQGRLIDGEPADKIKERLDKGHDVPAPSIIRIPGLDLLDRPPDSRSIHAEIRKSVEPETPRRQLHRESTPAFEDRSPSPSPVSHEGQFEDVEMTDALSAIKPAPQNSRLPLPQPTSSPDPVSSPMHAVTAPQTPMRPRSKSRSRSRSPAKAPVPPPDPVTSTPKSTKRGGRRKSAVQGSKVEKASTTKDKSRAVSRKMTAAVRDAAEKAGNKVKEAVARIEASVKGQDETTPRRSERIRAKAEREGTPQYQEL